MYIITGATGQLGGAIVEQLLTRVPAAQIGVSVREPQKAQQLADRGVRVRQGDYNDPTSLAHAFAGASQVLIISANSLGAAGIQLNRTAIDAAKQAGARRILYTSHMGASPTSRFGAMHNHAATEIALQQSGVPFTALHNGFYASSVLAMLGNAVQTGELLAPEDGPVSWTTHADLAEVAAIALNGEVLDGVTPALTAAEALDLTDVAAIVSELAQRPIRRIVVPDDRHRDALVARGVPEVYAQFTIGLFEASRRGEFSQVDPTLAHLLGRPPLRLQEILKSAIAPTA